MLLQEKLRNNALTLAANVSESLKAGLRQALIDGISGDETIPQLMRRIEEQLDSPGTFSVKPVLDAQGNVVRLGGTRRLDRSTVSELIARTEANRAYNEGNLDALGQGGVDRVQWLLASDACLQCAGEAEEAPGGKLGKIMSLDAAAGVIPAKVRPPEDPVFTKDERIAYESDLKIGVQALATRVSKMVRQSHLLEIFPGLDGLELTPGIGLRYLSAVGRLRVDLGYNFRGDEQLSVVTSRIEPDPVAQFGYRTTGDLAILGPRVLSRETESRFQLHISIGQAF